MGFGPMAVFTVDGGSPGQANVDATLPAAEWPLGALAAKMQQYCPMLGDLSAEVLMAEAGGDCVARRASLRRRGANAYHQKASAVVYFSLRPLFLLGDVVVCLTGCHGHRPSMRAPFA